MDKLLKLLSENSGFTTAEIAAMLGEPEDYIKAQIKEYENSGVIKGCLLYTSPSPRDTR